MGKQKIVIPNLIWNPGKIQSNNIKKTVMLLSVVIPTRNRADLLDGLLKSFNHQESVSFKWEVLIVDNGSNDHTKEVYKKNSAFLKSNLCYIFEDKAGLHNARHAGLKKAEGDLIAFLDDDMILSASWLKGALSLISRSAQIVGGRILPQWVKSPPEWVDKFTVQCPYGPMNCYLGLLDFGEEAKFIDPFHIFGGNFFAVKNILINAGGFHPDGIPSHLLKYRGDGETALMDKISSQGFKAVYDPAATAYHIIGNNRLNVDYFEQRSFNQGISDSFSDTRKNKHASEQQIEHTHTSLESRNDNVQLRIKRAYQKGYCFHQQEIQKDPDLLNYVLKPSFLE